MTDEKQKTRTVPIGDDCPACERDYIPWRELAAKYDRRIYLDIDGVLCTPRANVAKRLRGVIKYFDPICVDFLNLLCEETGAKIVLSSTWRMGAKWGDIADFLGTAGIRPCYIYRDPRGDHRKDDESYKTPVLKGIRGMEIEEHIELFGEPDSYVILDDDADFLPYQINNHFVHTCTYNGIAVQNFFKAKRILLGKTEPGPEEELGQESDGCRYWQRTAPAADTREEG